MSRRRYGLTTLVAVIPHHTVTFGRFCISPPSLSDRVPPSNGNYVDWRNRRYGKRPRRSRECFQRVLANPRANPASTPHIPFCGHRFKCQLLHVMRFPRGENSSLSLTPYVPCASTVHFREQPDVLIYAGCGWTYPAPNQHSPQIGM